MLLLALHAPCRMLMLRCKCCCWRCSVAVTDVMLQLSKLMKRLTLAKRYSLRECMRRRIMAAAPASAACSPWLQLVVSAAATAGLVKLKEQPMLQLSKLMMRLTLAKRYNK